jgi:hypothetical protein
MAGQQINYQSAKNKRGVVERTNSWHNRFRKLFMRYEKKVKNHLGLVQLSSGIIIYRKIILGQALNTLTNKSFILIQYLNEQGHHTQAIYCIIGKHILQASGFKKR